jgi:hypothetical protein
MKTANSNLKLIGNLALALVKNHSPPDDVPP